MNTVSKKANQILPLNGRYAVSIFPVIPVQFAEKHVKIYNSTIFNSFSLVKVKYKINYIVRFNIYIYIYLCFKFNYFVSMLHNLHWNYINTSLRTSFKDIFAILMISSVGAPVSSSDGSNMNPVHTGQEHLFFAVWEQ